MAQSKFHRIVLTSLLCGVSVTGLATGAHATRVLFSTDAAFAERDLVPGQTVTVDHGTTQIALDHGVFASFVDAAQFSIRSDGGIDLRSGTVTIVTPTGAPVEVLMPEGVKGSVAGANGSASFTANASGAHGSAISGVLVVGTAAGMKTFTVGAFWASAQGHAPQLVVANAPVAAPEAGSVRDVRTGGIAAAAENGTPVALGEALAAVGASGDVVAAARRVEAYGQNPSLTTFPRGDYIALTAYAARAASPYGGLAFRGAGADIVRTYFQYLSTGASPNSFQVAYARLLVNYLDLVRTGALPSGFTGATQAQLSAYIAFIGRTDGFGALSANNQTLIDAYLAFLQGGGTPDTFATNASSLVGAYLDYVRGGGDPAKFTQASASIISQYLAILQSGGIKGQLTAPNQALLAAYTANGNSIAFANTEATQLAAFTAYLNRGGLPSQYTAVDVATLKIYLQTLSDTGLFDRLLGSQSAFLRSYLLYLQTGGSVDSFSQLPINVLTQQAGAINTYYTFIQNGGTPSLYTGLNQTQILTYLTALQNAGLFNQLLGASSSGFFGDYYAYLNTGGNPDIYAGLPNVDLNAYASQVQAFVAYLKAGNLPASYTKLTTDQIRAYINALSASGKLATLTGGDASFLSSYLMYLQGGGAPNAYTGLPIVTYQNYATALSAYYSYLYAGGLPSSYTALTAAQIQAYLSALQANGQLTALLGSNASFFSSYFAYLNGGGLADAFTSLPLVTYQNYAASLTAYYTYLKNGGQPSGYTALTQEQILAYLTALKTNSQLTALLGSNATFFSSYYAYLSGGGTVDSYFGLPIVMYHSYAAALTAYYNYLSNGGLPSGYTALTAAQIQNYLNALKMSGQLTALLGTNADFFSTYLVYVSGGGSLDSYTGLPIFTYRDYATALTAYYAFLAGGGKPSAYTALTQTQILAFLQALTSAGQVTILLSGNATFFSNYYAFVNSGGTADQYASLPTAGGNVGTIATTPPPVYLGGFPQSTGHALTTENNGQNYSNALSIYVNPKTGILGQVVEAINYFGLGTTTAVDVAGDASVIIGRYVNGTTYGNYGGQVVGANGIAYTVLAPRMGTLPQSGTVSYSTMAATQPVFGSAFGAPGTFLGKLSIGFGATPTYTLNGSLTMPEPSGPKTYTFASAKNAPFSISSYGIAFSASLTGVGAACASTSCNIGFSGDFAGATPANRIGLIYITHDPATYSAQNIKGAVIFGADSTFTAAVVPPAPTPTPSPVPIPTPAASAPTGTGLQILAVGRTYIAGTTNRYAEGSFAASNAPVTATADGQLQVAKYGTDTVTRLTAANVDYGTAGGIIGWSRWSGGTVQYGTTATDVAANGGVAHVWGTPATAIPTTGSATYNMVGNTKPVDPSGTQTPGSVLDARLAVSFATAKVGFDAHISIGSTTYAIASAGGSVAPSMSLAANGTFSDFKSNTLIQGFLAGPGASHAGVSYYMTGANVIAGVIAFAKAP